MSEISVVESIFLQAIEQTPERRSEFLDAECPDDVTRREVERLLAAHTNVKGFLQDPVVDLAVTGDQTTKDRSGSQIGPYRLMEKVGEGGFGVVYVAEQQQPVRRRVAVKVIKPGMDSRDVIARFEAERQALALMDHPNIAKVLDAGTTDSGLPYFVMELVKGIPIVEYCDSQRLNTKERLDLFASVCNAVQHAHHKGVIHRDLKPSNILVAPHDGVPVIKVIDFGVAKAIGQQLTDKTVYTRFAQMIGTPLYMSPEQAEINALDVDTRSDIYSLGVLLYELLTGTTPFEKDRIASVAYDELRRIIKEEEPPKPSTRLTSLGERLSVVSGNRSTEATKLSKILRGDLDWIVMKALEKERIRRYETASAFSADVRRFLNNEAVIASPPTKLYLLSKFAKRNKTALATTASIGSILLAATFISSWSLRIALVQRDQARNLVASEERAKSELQTALDRAARSEYGANLNVLQADWKTGNVARAQRMLELTRNYDDRGFEWEYWNRQLSQALHTFPDNSGWVRDVEFSPDDKFVAAAGFDGEVTIWSLEASKLQVSLPHPDRVNTVQFSADGRRVLTPCGDGIARIWDVTLGQELEQIPEQDGEVTTSRFIAGERRIITGTASRDGRSKRGTVSVWNLESEEWIFQTESPGQIFSIGISPDEKWALVCRQSDVAEMWNVETGERSEGLAHPKSASVTVAAWSPVEGRIATGTFGGHVFVWDVGDKKAPKLEIANAGPIRSIEFSRDGKWILVACTQDVPKIFDAATGDLVYEFKGHASGVWSASFSRDNNMITSGGHYDQTVKVWPVKQLHEPIAVGSEGRVLAKAFASSNRLVLSASTGSGENYHQSVKIVDLSSGDVVRQWPIAGSPQGSKRDLTAFSASGDGERIVAAIEGDYDAFVWDSRGEHLFKLPHTNHISAAAITKDGQWCATGSGDKTVRLWNLSDGTQVKRFDGHQSSVKSVAISDDAKWIVSGDENEVIKWNIDTGMDSLHFEADGYSIEGLAISPAGDRIAAITWGSNGFVWDAATGEQLLELRGHTRVSQVVTFSPDGRRILTGSWDGKAKLWDATSGRELLNLESPRFDWVTSVDFADQGSKIVTGTMTGAFLWDAGH